MHLVGFSWTLSVHFYSLHGYLVRVKTVKWIASIECAALTSSCRCRSWSNQLINCRHNNFIHSSFMAYTHTQHPPNTKTTWTILTSIKVFLSSKFRPRGVHKLIKLKMIEAEFFFYSVHVCTEIALSLIGFSIFTLSTGEFLPMTNGWSKWLQTLKRRKAHANGHLIRWAILYFSHDSIAFVLVIFTWHIAFWNTWWVNWVTTKVCFERLPTWRKLKRRMKWWGWQRIFFLLLRNTR